MHYLSFYGLDEKPFALTPNPKYLYLSDQHRSAYQHLLYGIKNREGFVVMTGEVGTGKTTLLRVLMNKLRADRVSTAFVFNPSLTPLEFLQAVVADLGLPVSPADTKKTLVDRLNALLLEHLQGDREVVVMVDEAQDLAPEVLEEVRLLTNLETETQKLLQVILCGQPELAEMLRHPGLLQLNQRVSVRYHLAPMNAGDMRSYIYHRLMVAGSNGTLRFTRLALRKIYRHSRGIPREINKVCDRALLAGYVAQRRTITRKMVVASIRTLEGKEPGGRLWSRGS